MPAVQICNILRVADISADTLPAGLLHHLLPLREWTGDMNYISPEHIYKIHEWEDAVPALWFSRECVDFLKELEALADKRNFSYFRIIDLHLYKSK